MAAPLLEVEDLTVSFPVKNGEVTAVRGVSFEVHRGETLAIVGESGSGKSTMIRHFNRLIAPTAGRILVNGEDVLKYSGRGLEKLRRRTMSMVFQRFGLMPHRTVLQNVGYGLAVRGTSQAERDAKAMEWIATVGLSGYEHQYPTQLSGGMQQRVGLARALATDAEILLMDEAFSALDPLIRSQMQDQLIELQAQLGKTIVFITHDLDEALRIGDHIAILKDGKLSQVGTPPEILLNPADDYVSEFVRDVNRARVLTVDVVMKAPQARLTHDNLERALADMRSTGAKYGYVVRGDRYAGYTTQDTIEEAVAAKAAGKNLYDYMETGPVLRANAALEMALPAALEVDYPVPVLSDDDELLGVVSSKEMSSVLSPPPAANTDTVSPDSKAS